VNIFLPDFSHIYIEKEAETYPLAQTVINKYPRAELVEIEDYKSIFNRSGQDFQIQKKSMKLILAIKKPPYIYDCSPLVQSAGYANFYYTTPILNCLYNCDYCFLQGMYPSANVVIFVNESHFFSALNDSIKYRKIKTEPLLLSVSYNTDLMAFEKILPLCRNWIEFCKKTKDLKLEIRTKSTLFPVLKDIDPVDKVIFSWTLSPREIIKNHEFNTPVLSRRLAAAKAAIDRGWKIRLCFDPVILVSDWKEIYAEFFDHVFSTLPESGILDVSAGMFRMNKDYFKNIRKTRPDSVLYYGDYTIKNNVIGSDTEEAELKIILTELEKYLPLEKIIL